MNSFVLAVGPPGGGKTLVSGIASENGYVQVAMKKILSEYEQCHENDAAKGIRNSFQDGTYVADSIVTPLFQQYMLTHFPPSQVSGWSFFIEGIPRTRNQSFDLLDFLTATYQVEEAEIAMIHILVDREVAELRRQKQPGRPDKSPKVIKGRLDLYEDRSPEVLVHLLRTVKSYELDNNGTEEATRKQFADIFHEEAKRLQAIRSGVHRPIHRHRFELADA